MADRLREEIGVDVELIRGARGIFEVTVAGEVVAKKTLNGFPTDDECVAAVRAAVA